MKKQTAKQRTTTPAVNLVKCNMKFILWTLHKALETYLLINSSLHVKHSVLYMSECLVHIKCAMPMVVLLSLLLYFHSNLWPGSLFFMISRVSPEKANWIVYFYDSISLRRFLCMRCLFWTVFYDREKNMPNWDQAGQKAVHASLAKLK